MRIRTVIVGEINSIDDIQSACDASTLWSVGQMKKNPQLRQNLYKTGIYYKPELRGNPLPGVERFQTANSLFQVGHGDCDDLACVRAAQLQLLGISARAVPIRSSVGFHVVVLHENGNVEDPSARLGMLKK